MNDFELRELNQKIVELKIDQTSNLELNLNLTHPYIKIHIVDMLTGNYLPKQSNFWKKMAFLRRFTTTKIDLIFNSNIWTKIMKATVNICCPSQRATVTWDCKAARPRYSRRHLSLIKRPNRSFFLRQSFFLKFWIWTSNCFKANNKIY